MLFLILIGLSVTVLFGVGYIWGEPQVSMTFRPRDRVLRLRRLVPVRTGNTVPQRVIPPRRTRIFSRPTRSYLDIR